MRLPISLPENSSIRQQPLWCIYVYVTHIGLCTPCMYRRRELTWLPGYTNQLPGVEESDDRKEEQTAGGRRSGMNLQR